MSYTKAGIQTHFQLERDKVEKQLRSLQKDLEASNFASQQQQQQILYLQSEVRAQRELASSTEKQRAAEKHRADMQTVALLDLKQSYDALSSKASKLEAHLGVALCSTSLAKQNLDLRRKAASLETASQRHAAEEKQWRDDLAAAVAEVAVLERALATAQAAVDGQLPGAQGGAGGKGANKPPAGRKTNVREGLLYRLSQSRECERNLALDLASRTAALRSAEQSLCSSERSAQELSSQLERSRRRAAELEEWAAGASEALAKREGEVALLGGDRERNERAAADASEREQAALREMEELRRRLEESEAGKEAEAVDWRARLEAARSEAGSKNAVIKALEDRLRVYAGMVREGEGVASSLDDAGRHIRVLESEIDALARAVAEEARGREEACGRSIELEAANVRLGRELEDVKDEAERTLRELKGVARERDLAMGEVVRVGGGSGGAAALADEGPGSSRTALQRALMEQLGVTRSELVTERGRRMEAEGAVRALKAEIAKLKSGDVAAGGSSRGKAEQRPSPQRQSQTPTALFQPSSSGSAAFSTSTSTSTSTSYSSPSRAALASFPPATSPGPRLPSSSPQHPPQYPPPPPRPPTPPPPHSSTSFASPLSAARLPSVSPSSAFLSPSSPSPLPSSLLTLTLHRVCSDGAFHSSLSRSVGGRALTYVRGRGMVTLEDKLPMLFVAIGATAVTGTSDGGMGDVCSRGERWKDGGGVGLQGSGEGGCAVWEKQTMALKVSKSAMIKIQLFKGDPMKGEVGEMIGFAMIAGTQIVEGSEESFILKSILDGVVAVNLTARWSAVDTPV